MSAFQPYSSRLSTPSTDGEKRDDTPKGWLPEPKPNSFAKEMSATRQRIIDSYLHYTGQPFTGYDAVPRVVCQMCNATLKFQGASMTHHVMKHSDEKIFSCANCDFGSNFHSSVNLHLQRKHGDQSPSTSSIRDNRDKLDTSLAEKVRQCFPASAFE